MSDSTLVYDDDCGFCTWWADYIADRADFRLVGFAELTPEIRDRLPDDYERCAHFVTPAEVYSCGVAMEEAFVRSEAGEDVRPVVEFLRHFEEYPKVREWAYRVVADNRDVGGRIVSKEPPARRSDGDE